MSKGENMVERCARAIYAKRPYIASAHGWQKPDGSWATQVNVSTWDDATIRREECLRDAIAVIEALMEPTPEMLEAARVDFEQRWTDQDFFETDYVAAHQAMLRTILSQPNDEGEGK